MAFKVVDSNNIKDFKNFQLSELKCKCGGKYCNGFPVGASYELLSLAQRLRDHFGRALIITSFVRCTQHNKNVKGVNNSKHTQGRAMDFYIKGVSYSQLVSYINSIKKDYNSVWFYNITGSVMHLQILPRETGSYNLTRLLKKGCRGNDVKELQSALGGLTVDGIFGNLTKQKVRSFQSSKGLAVDGIVGKNTAHALGWTYKGN